MWLPYVWVIGTMLAWCKVGYYPCVVFWTLRFVSSTKRQGVVLLKEKLKPAMQLYRNNSYIDNTKQILPT